MTEFELFLKQIFDTYNGLVIDTEQAAKNCAPALLSLAKKEFEENTNK